MNQRMGLQKSGHEFRQKFDPIEGVRYGLLMRAIFFRLFRFLSLALAFFWVNFSTPASATDLPLADRGMAPRKPYTRSFPEVGVQISATPRAFAGAGLLPEQGNNPIFGFVWSVQYQ